MIYRISNPHDTANILDDYPSGMIIFDLAPDVDPSKIAIACKICTLCNTTSYLGLDDVDDEYCHIENCGGSLDGSYATLVIQGDKVVFALHKRTR